MEKMESGNEEELNTPENIPGGEKVPEEDIPPEEEKGILEEKGDKDRITVMPSYLEKRTMLPRKKIVIPPPKKED